MWVSCVTQLGINPKSTIYALLTSTAALSQQLRAKCDVLTVQVIKQEIARPTIEEQLLLNALEDNSFIREVYLVGDEHPLVYARVVAPKRTYVHFKEALDNLGEKFLGEAFIYKHPYTRSAFQYCLINKQPTRRSVFELDSYKILVQESFFITLPL